MQQGYASPSRTHVAVNLAGGVDPAGSDASASPQPLRARAAAALARLGDRRWAIKDPRLSLTLPLWRALAGPLSCVVHHIEVAASLHRRSHAEPDPRPAPGVHPDLEQLAATYQSAALRNSAGLPPLIVEHRRLLSDGSRELARIAAHLGVTLTDRLALDTNRLIEPGFWRHRVDAPAGVEATRA